MSLEQALLERIQRLAYELEYIQFLSKKQKEKLKTEIEKLKQELENMRKYGV